MQADARRDCAGLCFGSIIEGGSPIIGTTQRTVRQTWHSISSRSLTRTPPPKRWSPTHRRARMLSAKPVRLWAQATLVLLFLRRIRRHLHCRTAGQHCSCGICAGNFFQGSRLEIPYDGPDVSLRWPGSDEKGAEGRLRSAGLRRSAHLVGNPMPVRCFTCAAAKPTLGLSEGVLPWPTSLNSKRRPQPSR